MYLFSIPFLICQFTQGLTQRMVCKNVCIFYETTKTLNLFFYKHRLLLLFPKWITFHCPHWISSTTFLPTHAGWQVLPAVYLHLLGISLPGRAQCHLQTWIIHHAFFLPNHLWKCKIRQVPGPIPKTPNCFYFSIQRSSYLSLDSVFSPLVKISSVQSLYIDICICFFCALKLFEIWRYKTIPNVFLL